MCFVPHAIVARVPRNLLIIVTIGNEVLIVNAILDAIVLFHFLFVVCGGVELSETPQTPLRYLRTAPDVCIGTSLVAAHVMLLVYYRI